MVILYGIPNCDTVKKARAWLAAQGVDYRFHDFKTQGVPESRLPAWLAAVGWDKLVNRQGTTWRRLDAATDQGLSSSWRDKIALNSDAKASRRPA